MSDRPIGWWLKRLDRLVDDSFEHALEPVGMSRRAWQALNVLDRGPATADELSGALAPFWAEAAGAAEALLADLSSRGWVATRDGRWTLTEAGREAQAEARSAVAAVRERLSLGVSATEYAQVLDVLARMVANLEQGTDQHDP